jgi:hypothetical protein
MECSQETKDLDEAISLVQQEVKKAIKDKKNPHLKNEYASLESIIDVLRPITSKHGISIMQYPEYDGTNYLLRTRIAHKSGQFIISVMPLLIAIVDMQKFGSAITYARRYALSSIFCIATGEDDDDGEACKKVYDNKQCAEKKEPIKQPKVDSLLSKVQENAIMQLVQETGTDLQKVLEHFKVAEVSQLSHEQATAIINQLKKR